MIYLLINIAYSILTFFLNLLVYLFHFIFIFCIFIFLVYLYVFINRIQYKLIILRYIFERKSN